jgi:lysyl-tRNA synthetase class II
MGIGYYLRDVGIDRTVMMITDHIRIQEVLLFPAMKPEENNAEKV